MDGYAADAALYIYIYDTCIYTHKAALLPEQPYYALRVNTNTIGLSSTC